MQSPQISLTREHLQILDYTDNLFTRWSLRKNSYLYKHIKPNLQIPIFIIAEERRVAQITQSQAVIIEALSMSDFVQVEPHTRVIRIVQLPCVRVKDEPTLLKIQKIVKAYLKNPIFKQKLMSVKPIEYKMSPRTQDGYYYFCLKTKKKQDRKLLKQIIDQSLKTNKQLTPLIYAQQPLYDDIKQNILRIRKSKTQRQGGNNSGSYGNKHGVGYNNNKNNNYTAQTQLTTPLYSKYNMMAMYPYMYYQVPGYNGMMTDQNQPSSALRSYGVFIRKAVDSDNQQVTEQQKIQNIQGISSISQPQKTDIKQQKQSNTQSSSQVEINRQNQKSEQIGKAQNKNTKNKNVENKDENNANLKKSKKHGNNKKLNKQKDKQPKIQLDEEDFPSIG